MTPLGRKQPHAEESAIGERYRQESASSCPITQPLKAAI
jgi:hypothetical protein